MKRENWEKKVLCPTCGSKAETPAGYDCNHFRCKKCNAIWNIYRTDLT